jgi:hypothetical protein
MGVQVVGGRALVKRATVGMLGRSGEPCMYREAGLSLRDDLDPVAFMYRNGVPTGRTPVPSCCAPDIGRVLDFGTFLDAPMAPAFTRFAPPGSPAALALGDSTIRRSASHRRRRRSNSARRRV